MDVMQYAGHVDLAMSPEVWGVTGQLRGQVRYEVCGKFARVWLKNGQGLLILDDGSGAGLKISRIQHVDGAPEDVFVHLHIGGARMENGTPLDTVPAGDPERGIALLRDVADWTGYPMGDGK